jgi:3-methyladenine DNA glycosylase AlkD
MATFHVNLARFVTAQLRAAADPAKASAMQVYMKTDMPFYGVQKPVAVPIYREMKGRFKPNNAREYEAGVLALWKLKHREEKYAALEFAGQHPEFTTFAALKLYERLVREGAWWDLVDWIAVALVSPVFLEERDKVRPVIERWIDDRDLWVRRTALLAHNRHKRQTDQRQLFDHCLRRGAEKEFFIRKAIGWALRQYSYSNPQGVRRFLLANRDRLSGLSLREGAKRLVRAGLITPRDLAR